ncbi:MAG TPA: OmpA family protein [Polyangiales bacterium]|nr:OmpA family protein [Polyangiales bacterium]
MNETNALGVAALLCAAIGCGTAAPPRQLLDARAAYNEARLGKAAELAPAELHTAKVALNAAEQAFTDDPESAETYALAYVALRTSQLVQTQANTKAAKAELDQIQREIDQRESDDMLRTRNELMQARRDLSSERAARVAAEARERDAMQRLAAAAAVNVKEEARGTVIVLPGSVLFSSGRYELTGEAQRKLTMVAETVAPQASSHDILVEGHTDSQGTPTSNQVLSESRARAVMDFLVSRGVPAQAITSVGIGQARPIADNSSADGRAINRRVEIIIKPREAR